MHIHRSLEDDLIKKIEQAKECVGKSLILVCGNVGDGKSHVISYLKHTRSDLLDGFIIHNDATESRSPNRDEKEELALEYAGHYDGRNAECRNCFLWQRRR